MSDKISAESVMGVIDHIREVGKNIGIFTNDLIRRANEHDKTKLESPEVEIFSATHHELATTKYGTPEYDALLEKVKPAISHHYSKNRHHPEFHKNGIEDMTLIDLIEMLADWKAATARNKDGNIRKSIEINTDRFGMSPQLRRIFENTVREYFD